MSFRDVLIVGVLLALKTRLCPFQAFLMPVQSGYPLNFGKVRTAAA